MTVVHARRVIEKDLATLIFLEKLSLLSREIFFANTLPHLYTYLSKKDPHQPLK